MINLCYLAKLPRPLFIINVLTWNLRLLLLRIDEAEPPRYLPYPSQPTSLDVRCQRTTSGNTRTHHMHLFNCLSLRSANVSLSGNVVIYSSHTTATFTCHSGERHWAIDQPWTNASETFAVNRLEFCRSIFGNVRAASELLEAQ